eukprot:979951-Pleurochrysis_carterae.AAC.1
MRTQPRRIAVRPRRAATAAHTPATMPGKQPVLQLLPFERDFCRMYGCVTHEDFITANNNTFPMEWGGAR